MNVSKIVLSVLTITTLNSKIVNSDDNYERKVIVKQYLRAYNPNIEDGNLNQINKVLTFYNFNNLSDAKYLMGQITSESGARHYKSGSVIKSNTGAIGICQILGSTAYDCMSRIMNRNDIEGFYSLGASNFNFIVRDDISKRGKIKLCKKWLESPNNNIIMWGKLMSLKCKNKSIISALISYNVGDGGYRKFIRNGGKRSEHHYIKHINKNIRYIKKRLTN